MQSLLCVPLNITKANLEPPLKQKKHIKGHSSQTLFFFGVRIVVAVCIMTGITDFFVSRTP